MTFSPPGPARRASRKFALVALSLATLVPPATAQLDALARSRAAYGEAVVAYRAADYPAFLEHMREAASLRPNHPQLTYALAAALARTGDHDAAVRTLAHLADLGVTVPLQDEEAFAALAGTKAFESLLLRFEQNDSPLMRSRRVFTWEEDGFVPEGVAYDPRTGDFYVGSIRTGAVVRIRDGQAERFVDDGVLWSAMGMTVDTTRHALWVATSALDQTRHADSTEIGRAGVVRFDLDTGRIVRRYDLPADTLAHTIGDLALAPDGTVYATDSRTPTVYRISPTADRLEAWIADGPFASLQGLALSDDGRTLHVADYSLGLFRIDTATGSVTHVPQPERATLLGIDGMAAVPGGLLAVQNGIRPYRILRIDLDEEGRSVVGTRVVEASHPDFDEPTLGTVVGERFVYVANSHWNRFTAEGDLPEGLTGPILLDVAY